MSLFVKNTFKMSFILYDSAKSRAFSLNFGYFFTYTKIN